MGGLYGFYNKADFLLSIVLIVIGASLFGGANHGVLFYFGFNDERQRRWGRRGWLTPGV